MKTRIAIRRPEGRRATSHDPRAARAGAVIDGASPVTDDEWAVAKTVFALRAAYLTPPAPPGPAGPSAGGPP